MRGLQKHPKTISAVPQFGISLPVTLEIRFQNMMIGFNEYVIILRICFGKTTP